MGKIYFQTISYHAEKTLDRCVDGVLNQTYRAEDIVYYICNNPYMQPDPTEAMVREYAAREPRMRAFYNMENYVYLPENREAIEFIRNLNDDDYLAYLDSDDAYELNFLEEMLPFMEKNELEIAACGSSFIDAASGKTLFTRAMQAPLVMTEREEFARYFPYYHQFMRTTWGKLYSGRVARHMYTELNMPDEKRVTYGADTIFAFSALRHAKRVGIYPKTLHRYYMHSDAGSYRYNPKRPESDVVRHEDAWEYLADLGPVSEKNRIFLAKVYANGVRDTVDTLRNAALTPEEKLHECRRITELPVTRENFQFAAQEIESSKKSLLFTALSCSDISDSTARADFCAIVDCLAPKCSPAVALENVPLLAQEKLVAAILDDDADALLSGLLRLIHEQKHTKRYNISAMVQALSKDKPLLRDAAEKTFLRRYGDIYLSVWRGRYAEALETMTGVLLNGEKVKEFFLQLYLSLAALQNHASAFVFGKVRLAQLHMKRNEKDACRAILKELAEMGVEENEEIAELREALEKG